MTRAIKYDSRTCFGIAYYATEAEAQLASDRVKAQKQTYNGGFLDGMSCGRDKAFDHERDGIKYFAVTTA